VTRAIGSVLLAGALGTVGLLAWASDLSRPAGWLWAAAVTLWALAPYAVAARATRLVGASRRARATLLVGASLLAAAGLTILTRAFVLEPDPQSGLVPLFLPAWQLVGLAPFAIAAQWLARRERVSAGTPGGTS
jgi:hypothetical protein